MWAQVETAVAVVLLALGSFIPPLSRLKTLIGRSSPCPVLFCSDDLLGTFAAKMQIMKHIGDLVGSSEITASKDTANAWTQ